MSSIGDANLVRGQENTIPCIQEECLSKTLKAQCSLIFGIGQWDPKFAYISQARREITWNPGGEGFQKTVVCNFSWAYDFAFKDFQKITQCKHKVRR